VVLKIDNEVFREFLEGNLLKEMKKRGYWVKGEEPVSSWNKYEGNDILEINLKKTLFTDKNDYFKHIEVLKKCAVSVKYYNAEDCSRYQFNIPIYLRGKIHGYLKLLFSDINYSYYHKAEEGKLYSMDAFAFIDFNAVKNQADINSIVGIMPEIKNLESEVWKTYLENDFTV